MNINTTHSIIKHLLERSEFSLVYSDDLANEFLPATNITPANPVEFLYTASVVGRKSIGFFSKLPVIPVTLPLRNACIFITYSIPQELTIPAIVIKDVKNILNKIVLACNISLEYKVPVAIIINPNILYSYITVEDITGDTVRILPSLSKESFNNQYTPADIKDIFIHIDEALKSSSLFNKDEAESGNLLSLKEPNSVFPEYFIPSIVPDIIKTLCSKVSVPFDEAEIISTFLFKTYGLNLDIEPQKATEPLPIKVTLCAGCPFVSIVLKAMSGVEKIFTDISCKAIHKAFDNITNISLGEYIAIASSGMRHETLFIGKASAYKPHVTKLLDKSARVILLNDSNLKNIVHFKSISHPKKLSLHTRFTLFPYSCRNIINYSKVKINLKSPESVPQYLESLHRKTFCPAIYVSASANKFGSASIACQGDFKINISKEFCTGCLACRNVVENS